MTHSPGIASYTHGTYGHSAQDLTYPANGHPELADWVTDLLHACLASYGRLAAGKGCHAYIPIKMVSGVQDITCVFVEVAGSYEKTLILQYPGMVCSPPVVSKCLGEAHRRLGIIYINYII